MAAKPTCLVCQKEMERGFVTDVGANVVMLPRWCAGEPKAGLIYGEASKSRYAAGLKVVAYRCPQCEALRLYAPSEQ